jgi:Arc/MetJ family transcription regulator
MGECGERGIASCPYLPPGDDLLSAVSMRRAGLDRGEAFYELALRCAQSLWQRGLPAQAILLLNRAFSADLTGRETVLDHWPLPYAAMRWVMEQRGEGQFIGNPRRHFQHLATRMVEPRREVRSWRAWACWAIAREVFPEAPGDLAQIEREGLVEPTLVKILRELKNLGLPGEAELWRGVCGGE